MVDLGSLGTAAEQRLVAQAVLSTLWRSRHSREPCLVVVDEAHNICSADPRDEVGRLSTDTVVQIAAEGRKYRLYLLTSTQREQGGRNVVSQCDNLLLMRMNSEADLTDLGRLFSFVPRVSWQAQRRSGWDRRSLRAGYSRMPRTYRWACASRRRAAPTSRPRGRHPRRQIRSWERHRSFGFDLRCIAHDGWVMWLKGRGVQR